MSSFMAASLGAMIVNRVTIVNMDRRCGKWNGCFRVAATTVVSPAARRLHQAATDPQLLEKMLEKNVVIPPEAGEMSGNVRKCSVFAAGGPPWGAPPSAFFGFSHPEGTGLVLKLRAGGRQAH